MNQEKAEKKKKKAIIQKTTSSFAHPTMFAGPTKENQKRKKLIYHPMKSEFPQRPCSDLCRPH